MGLNLNAYSLLQAITSSTPQGLVEIVRSIRGVTGFDVISITAIPGEYTCFFRSKQLVKVVNGTVNTDEIIES